MPNTQKGFAPIVIIVLAAVILTAGGFVVKNLTTDSSLPENNPVTINASPSATVSASPSSTAKATAKKSPSPSPSASAQTKSTAHKTGICEIVTPVSTHPDPLVVNLAYGLIPANNEYMTEAQWDYDGDGNWDTGMSSSNGSMSHNYGKAGSFNTKLQLKTSDGKITPVCSKTVIVSSGVNVSFSGIVFKDNNCNDMRDSSEQGISEIPIRFFKSDHTLYKTVTSSEDGGYNVTTNIRDGDSLTIQPSPDLNNGKDPSIVAYSPYKIHYDVPFATLNSHQRSITKDVPLVPSENLSSCSN